MKKYSFKADKLLWEKAYQNFEAVHTAPATVSVLAQDEKSALALAAHKLKEAFADTGILLGTPRLCGCRDLPVDWSYGYGDMRRSGDTRCIPDLVGNARIR